MTMLTGANRYLADAVKTVSPARLLVMLYDRLVLDVDRAEAALRAGESANTHLLHAQEIVIELRASLNTDVWDGAERLAAIYGFVLGELIKANINRDADQVAGVRELVVPLRDAWREAADATLAAPAAAS
jgi:flagellar protein FliS